MTIDRLLFLQDLIEKEQQLSMTGCFFKQDADDIIAIIDGAIAAQKINNIGRDVQKIIDDITKSYMEKGVVENANK